MKALVANIGKFRVVFKIIDDFIHVQTIHNCYKHCSREEP